MRRIARARRRVAAQRDDVAHSRLPVPAGPPSSTSPAAGADAGQVRRRHQPGLAHNSRHGGVGARLGAAAGAIGHRHEARPQRLQPADAGPELLLQRLGLRRQELEGQQRRRMVRVSAPAGRQSGARSASAPACAAGGEGTCRQGICRQGVSRQGVSRQGICRQGICRQGIDRRGMWQRTAQLAWERSCRQHSMAARAISRPVVAPFRCLARLHVVIGFTQTLTGPCSNPTAGLPSAVLQGIAPGNDRGPTTRPRNLMRAFFRHRSRFGCRRFWCCCWPAAPRRRPTNDPDDLADFNRPTTRWNRPTACSMRSITRSTR